MGLSRRFAGLGRGLGRGGLRILGGIILWCGGGLESSMNHSSMNHSSDE